MFKALLLQKLLSPSEAVFYDDFKKEMLQRIKGNSKRIFPDLDLKLSRAAENYCRRVAGRLVDNAWAVIDAYNKEKDFLLIKK